MKISAFNGESGEYLEDWEHPTSVELVFESYGPETGKHDAPTSAGYLHHQRSMPGGIGVLLVIDARDEGAPDVWTGRYEMPQFGAGPTVSAQLSGPRSWHESVGVAVAPAAAATAASVINAAYAEAQEPAWTTFHYASAYKGVVVEEPVRQPNLWALIEHYRQTRGEEPYFTARPGEVGYDLAWTHPLEADAKGAPDAQLIDGKNCRLSSSGIGAGLTRDQAVAAAQSWGAGSELVQHLVRAPFGAELGRRAALEAALVAARTAGLTGQPVAAEPETRTREALEIMLETRLRRLMVPVVAAQASEIDRSLWPKLRPGTVVRTRLSDPFGLFTKALARVTSLTVRPTDPPSASVSLELWAQES